MTLAALLQALKRQWRSAQARRRGRLLRCQIVRWVSNEPQPGWVEARVTDFHGRTWVIFDKPVMFSTDANKHSAFPIESGLMCEMVSRRVAEDGRVAVLVTTRGVEAEDGTSAFEVDEGALGPPPN